MEGQRKAVQGERQEWVWCVGRGRRGVPMDVSGGVGMGGMQSLVENGGFEQER